MVTLGSPQGLRNQDIPVREKQVFSIIADLEDRTRRLYEKVGILSERLAPIIYDRQLADKQATESPKQQVCPMAFTIRESVETLDHSLYIVSCLIDNLEI